MPNLEKPHLGRLEQWTRVHRGSCVHYYEAIFIGHPKFHGSAGYTSVVLKTEGNEIETLNSRYTLGEPAGPMPVEALKALLEEMGPKVTAK